MSQPACVSLFDLRPDLRPAQAGDSMVVDGYLNLSNTSITHLPDGLSVRQSLNLYKTSIRYLPKRLSVGQHLYLHHTPITCLSDGLSVGGTLHLTRTPLTHLPKDLWVGGRLDMRDTRIAHLPLCLYVGGRIQPSDTLVDLVRFRATLTEPMVLQTASAYSAHEAVRLHRLLAPYPDVVRIWGSIDSGWPWIIDPAGDVHP